MNTEILLVSATSKTSSDIGAILTELQSWPVIEADSAAVAIGLLTTRASEIAVIVVDLTSLGDLGIAICAEIKMQKTAADKPMLVVADGGQETQLNHAFMAGVADFISSPATKVEVAARIKAMFRLHNEIGQRVMSGSHILGATSTATARELETTLLCARGGFERAIAELGPTCVENCGLIVIRHIGAQRVQLGKTKMRRDLSTYMANILARVEMPAGDLLAAADTDIYVHAALHCSPSDLLRRAERYADAVKQVGKNEYTADAMQLSIAVSQAGRFATLAEALAEALLATDMGREGLPAATSVDDIVVL